MTEPITISPCGTKGKRKNPYVKEVPNFGSENHRMYVEFERDNPYYALTEVAEPNSEREGELIEQLFSPTVGWVNKSEVKDLTKFIREPRQAWQLVSNK